MNWQKAYEVEVDLTPVTPEDRAAMVEYLRGSAVPSYVERLEEPEYVVPIRYCPITRMVATASIVFGLILLLVGFATARSA